MNRQSRTFDVTSVDDLSTAVAEIIAQCKRSAHGSQSVVLALSGDLGAGKTTLVQTLARQLGVTETVTSPTFVVMKQYETPDEIFSTLVHIDAYRVEDVDEMRPLRFTEVVVQPQTLVCIEWAERIAAVLPPERLTVELTVTAGGVRTLIFSYGN